MTPLSLMIKFLSVQVTVTPPEGHVRKKLINYTNTIDYDIKTF